MTYLSTQSQPSALQEAPGLPLSMILSTWADLCDNGAGTGESSFSMHARAAADRLVALEAVAHAARRLLDRARPGLTVLDHETADELDYALASLSSGLDRQHSPQSRRSV